MFLCLVLIRSDTNKNSLMIIVYTAHYAGDLKTAAFKCCHGKNCGISRYKERPDPDVFSGSGLLGCSQAKAIQPFTAVSIMLT